MLKTDLYSAIKSEDSEALDSGTSQLGSQRGLFLNTFRLISCDHDCERRRTRWNASTRQNERVHWGLSLRADWDRSSLRLRDACVYVFHQQQAKHAMTKKWIMG